MKLFSLRNAAVSAICQLRVGAEAFLDRQVGPLIRDPKREQHVIRASA